jgi:hypothetical protein
MSGNKQLKMELSRLHRVASTFSEGGRGQFKSLLGEALRHKVVTEDSLARAFDTESNAVKNWRKGNAPSIAHARRVAGYITEQLKRRLG